MDTIFDAITLGDIPLKNRAVMAPLTRGRAGESRIPNDLMAQYYGQRAGDAGLIIAEATAISEQGYGWPGAPAIYNDDHEDGWKKVTKAVHDKNGKIFLQLWHMGRVKDESTYRNNEQAVAPSAIAASQNIRRASGKAYPVPRALDADELPGLVNDYVDAAKRALRAGFDGVEVHSANGYLLDQFLRDGSNQRQDEYGGSIENRIRFPLMVIKAVAKAIGPGKVGVRISPTNPFNDMKDSDPAALFSAFAKELNALGLAYLHILEPIKEEHAFANGPLFVTPIIRDIYDGNLIVNGGYGLDSANTAIADKTADAVAFGVPYLANPDLTARFKAGADLNEPDQATFYAGGAEGYTDYPALDQNEEAA